MMIKCEYVYDSPRISKSHNVHITWEIQLATRAKALNILVTPPFAAEHTDTHVFFSGLLHMWVKDADGSRFRFQAINLIKSHINLRRK